MRTLELFCGTKSFSKVAKARGHETFTVDIEPKFEPDMVADVGQLKVDDLPVEMRHPDVVWASPPCQCFSVMVISKNWRSEKGKYPIPIREKTVEAMKLAEHTIELIKDLKPTYYFIENPRAMLRKMPFMKGWHHSTVTYCQYGLDYQKATDIWNNCYEWRPRPVCSPRSPCHVRVPRNSHNGLQSVARKKGITNTGHHDFQFTPSGYKTSRRISQHPGDMGSESHRDPSERAVVPPELCEEIIIACEMALNQENNVNEEDK